MPAVAGLFFVCFFSSVVFKHQYLAPGDALTYSMAAFHQQPELWCDAVGCGMPVAADPQYQTWYPVLWICRAAGGYNLLVILAYVIAFCNAFALSYAITRLRFAACLGGIVYSMSGFMFAHLGHVTIIHAACWLPLLILSIEKLSREMRWKWLLLGQIAVAMTTLGGHSQILAISLVMSGFFALFKAFCREDDSSGSANSKVDFRPNWQLLSSYICMCIFGLGLVAMQILPTLQLASLSSRADWSFENFVSFSFPPRQLAQFFFPFLFCQQVGYELQNYARSFYVGEWSVTELTAYVGFIPVILAIVGVAKGRGRSKWFWLVTAVASLVIAAGSATPLAKVLFYVPIINHFRCPSRYVLLFELAVSLLAAIGAATIERYTQIRKRQALTAIASLTTGFAALSSFVWCQKYLRYHIAKSGLDHVDISPFSNSYVGVPLILLAVSFIVLWLWTCAPKVVARQLFVVAMLLVDLSSFDYFCEWRFRPADEADLAPPNVVTELCKIWKDNSHQFRIAVPLADLGGVRGCPPNLNSMWSLPSPAFYSPLVTQRLSQLLQDSGTARLQTICKPGDATLDIASVKYLIVPKGTAVDAHGDINILSTSLPFNTAGEAPKFVQTTHTDGQNLVYENKRFLPRFRFVYKTQVLDEVKTLASIHGVHDAKSGKVNFQDTAILAANDVNLSSILERLRGSPPNVSPTYRVNVLSDSGSEKSLDVQTSEPGLLMVSDQFFPGWSAKVDGAPAILTRANYNFDAILVDAGRHRVDMTFTFQPFRLGLILSAVSLASIIVAGLFWHRSKTPT